jgi:hypothetical protein
MSAAARHDPAPPLGCWCCGRPFQEEQLVRLGEHPEVGLCLQCAIWVKRRAVARHHKQHPTVLGRRRTGIDAVRDRVIERGWHERGRLGALLRGIDRYLH